MIMRAIRADRIGVGWIAAEAAACNHADAWQYLREGPNHGGLRRALLAAYQDSADFWRDGGQDQGECHVLGTDDCGERKSPHLTPFLQVSTPAAHLGWAGVRGMGRRPATAVVLTSRRFAENDQTSESQWRDRSGLAPDSSAVAASHHVTSDWIACAPGLDSPRRSRPGCRNLRSRRLHAVRTVCNLCRA